MRYNNSQKCWNCCVKFDKYQEFCHECQKIQSSPRIKNYFTCFNLKESIDCDIKKIEKIFVEKNRLFHPDLYSHFSAKERFYATHMTAYINEAYENLTNIILRIKHLLALHGQSMDNNQTTTSNNDLLLEILEEQEILSHCNDTKAIKEMIDKHNNAKESTFIKMEESFIEMDFLKIKDELCRYQYYDKLLQRAKNKIYKIESDNATPN